MRAPSGEICASLTPWTRVRSSATLERLARRLADVARANETAEHVVANLSREIDEITDLRRVRVRRERAGQVADVHRVVATLQREVTDARNFGLDGAPEAARRRRLD